METHNRRTLKYFLLGLIITIILVSIIAYVAMQLFFNSCDVQGKNFWEKYNNYLDIDTCLDIGICKEGLTIKIEGQEFIVNKQTCVQNNGQWIEDGNNCKFR